MKSKREEGVERKEKKVLENPRPREGTVNLNEIDVHGNRGVDPSCTTRSIDSDSTILCSATVSRIPSSATKLL